MILNPSKNTISGNYYATIIKSELLSAIKRKRPQLQRSRVLLHYDNMSSHNSRVVSNTVKELNVELLPHPPYSPDLAICHFWLFQKLKNKLHGQKYELQQEFRCTLNRHLREMSRDDLQHVFQL